MLKTKIYETHMEGSITFPQGTVFDGVAYELNQRTQSFPKNKVVGYIAEITLGQRSFDHFGYGKPILNLFLPDIDSLDSLLEILNKLHSEWQTKNEQLEEIC